MSIALAVAEARLPLPRKTVAFIRHEFAEAERARFGGWISPRDDAFNTTLFDAANALRRGESREVRKIVVLSQLARGRNSLAAEAAREMVRLWPHDSEAKALRNRAAEYTELDAIARRGAKHPLGTKVHVETIDKGRYVALVPSHGLFLFAKKAGKWVTLDRKDLGTFEGGALPEDTPDMNYIEDLLVSHAKGQPLQIAVVGFWGDTSGGPCQSAEVFRLVGNALKPAGNMAGHGIWIGDSNHDGRWEYRNSYEIGRLMSHAGMPRWQDVYELKGGTLQRTSPSHPEIYKPYVAQLRETLLEFPSDPVLPFYFERAWRWSGHRSSSKAFYRRLAILAKKSRPEYQNESGRKSAIATLLRWGKNGAPKNIGLGPEFALD